jgi:hypothetical protein
MILYHDLNPAPVPQRFDNGIHTVDDHGTEYSVNRHNGRLDRPPESCRLPCLSCCILKEEES